MSKQMKDLGKVHGHEHGWEDAMHGNTKLPRPEIGLGLFDPAYTSSYHKAYEVAFDDAFDHRKRTIQLQDKRREKNLQQPERER